MSVLGQIEGQKWYRVIFMCISTRAIHLELAGNLSTDSFILALRYFISRWGHPKQIRNDNGTNFIGAERKLRHTLKGLNQSGDYLHLKQK